VGVIAYPRAKASEEAMFEAALEAGADNCESNAEQHVVTCSPESFGSLRDALEKSMGEPASAKLTWIPKNTTPVGEEQAKLLLKFIDVLEDNDDVQEVFANYEISDEILEKLSA
jgi:transcriptional/translational regulatory protein YebC/TACO1